MRIRPDGAELLQAARVVLNASIVPSLPSDRREDLRAIDRAMALAEDRLARDVGATADDVAVLEEAHATMRGAVFEALPPERRYDARLVAKAIAVATRQVANGHALERREYDRLTGLLGESVITHATTREIRCMLPSLNERLGTRIRAGKADGGTVTFAATRAHLEASTREALSESNPAYRRHRSQPAVPLPHDTQTAALPFSVVDATLAAWNDVPQAFLRAFPIAAAQVPLVRRIDAWWHLRGALGEAVYASCNAALASQTMLVGWFTQRLAANSHVPMAAVESAHQVHDLSLAIADVGSAFFKITLAPSRVGAYRAEATRVP